MSEFNKEITFLLTYSPTIRRSNHKYSSTTNIRFDTIHACDRRTDYGISVAHIHATA